MRKIFIITTSIFLLAAGCQKKPQASNQQNPPALSSQATYTITQSTSTIPSLVHTPPAYTPASQPLTLNLYNNDALHFKMLYLSDFINLSPADVQNNSFPKTNSSACLFAGGEYLNTCFALKNEPYQATNLSSAAVAVRILANKTSLDDCGVFEPAVLGRGTMLGGKEINGVVFLIAVAIDAGAGTFSETHLSRAWYMNSCYEIDETARWTNASVYSPPRKEFNKADLWGKLDVLTLTFEFLK